VAAVVTFLETASEISCERTVLADLSVVQMLLLQLRRVALLTAAEVLLLDLVEPALDVLVGDLDPHRRGLRLALGLLDEQRDGLALHRGEVGRPLLRERTALLHEAPLGLRHQRIEGRLVDVNLPDDGDVVALQARTTAAAACEQRREEENRKRNFGLLHRKAPAMPPGARAA